MTACTCPGRLLYVDDDGYQRYITCIQCGRVVGHIGLVEPLYTGDRGLTWRDEEQPWWRPDEPSLAERLAGVAGEAPRPRSRARNPDNYLWDRMLDDPMPFGLPPGRIKTWPKRIWNDNWDGGWDNAVDIIENAS